MRAALDLLSQLDLMSFMLLFWHFVIFDFPRYSLSVIAVGLTALVDRRHREEHWDGPLSILLVGHNEGDSLEAIVRSLEEQTRGELEIVVVDDGSSDDMARIGRRLQAEGRVSAFVATGLRGGKAAALNLGLTHCRHEVIVAADIDVSFDRDAIDQIVAPLADPTVGAVSGNLGVRNRDESLLTAFQALQYLISISVGRRFTSGFNALMIVSGAFGAFRRQAIEMVGGWDVGPGDDSNLTTKIRRAGWRIRFAPRAWALTDVPPTLLGFTRQRLRWNRSIVRNRMRKFRQIWAPRQAEFSFTDLLGTANILFFQVALSFSFVIYLVWLFWMLGDQAWIIVLTVTIIYVLDDLILFVIVARLYPEREPLKLGIYLVGFSLFKSYLLRFIRMTAYVDELIFRRSYQDPFYPAKVRRQVEKF